jgi:hypothetical protein
MKIISLPLAVLAAFAGAGFAADDSLTMLDPFTVKVDRIEDFGFDLSTSGQPDKKGGPPVWCVHFVVPHTAAAKAGLKPGDRLLKLDGQPVVFRTWREWARARKEKRDAVALGDRVTWSLEVASADAKESRTLTLTLPTPAPHWGASIWRAPEDRIAAVVPEAGPLAELARTVLDNGVWTQFGWPFLKTKHAPEFSGANPRPLLAHTWTIFDDTGGPHKITVMQVGGRTDIILAAGKSGSSAVEYLTSPTGLLEDAVIWPGRKPLPASKAIAGFQREMEFWTRKVGKVSPRWPLERLPSESAATKRP